MCMSQANLDYTFKFLITSIKCETFLYSLPELLRSKHEREKGRERGSIFERKVAIYLHIRICHYLRATFVY